MANKNPLRGAYIAQSERPHAEPHAKSLTTPTHKQKVVHKGRPPVEMPAGHGLRTVTSGRDAIKGNKLPGLKEPSGIQRTSQRASLPHSGPMPVR